MENIFHRVSIRKYEDKPVEKEKIFQILKAGMQAPSACNQQPWEFYVVKDKAVIGRLSEASPYAKCAKDAPVVFVPCFRSKGIAPEYFNIDMSAAVEDGLEQAAKRLGGGGEPSAGGGRAWAWRGLDGNFAG